MEIDIKKILRWKGIGFIAILIIFSVFDFYPNLQKANRLSEKIRQDRESEEKMSQADKKRQIEGLEEELKRSRGDFQLIQEGIAKIQNKVVRIKNVPLVTQEIIGIAETCNIELSSIRPLSLQPKGLYEILPITIKVKCTYEDLLKFLSEVETSCALAFVKELSILKEGSIYPKLDIELTACALFGT